MFILVSIKTLLVLSLTVMAMNGIGGCGVLQSATAAEHTGDYVYDATVLALVVVDQAEASYLRSLTVPTQEQLTKARRRVARLRAVRDSLEIIGSTLNQVDAQQLRLVLRELRGIVESLKQVGGRIPPEVDKALERAESWTEVKS